MSGLEQKQEVLNRIKELQIIVIEPWLEINKIILELDGSHNRIYGLGIKSYSFQTWEAIGKLIGNLEEEITNDINTDEGS